MKKCSIRHILVFACKFIFVGILVVLMFSAACESQTKNPESKEEEKEDTRVFKDDLERVTPDENVHFTMATSGDGFDVYAPVENEWGYRYGPSILYYPDGSVDAWFATPGTLGEWDWFTYKHSDDGGRTWSKEKVVLQPTPDSMDHYSVCDPGVIYFGGYYYMGYTSTIVSTNGGINNNCFVARSKNPDGPYEKWNGSGWGGDPQPIVYYNESDSSWGAGELSFVELDGTLYCYYTWTCPDGDYEMVATADSKDENWPATMKYQGVAYKKESGQDSCDVVYVEDYGKFLAFSTYNRFTASSGICIMESNDGITFEKVAVIRSGISQFCHNMGISKRPNGHIQLNDSISFIGYAYSSGGPESGFWGKWATRFQEIDLSVYEGKITNSDKGGNGVLRSDYFWPLPEEKDLWTVGVGTLPHKIEFHIDDDLYDLELYWYDTRLQTHRITDASGVKFSGYDENIISFDGLKIKAKSVGKTNVTVTYDGCSVDFKVYVREAGFPIGKNNPDIVSFRPVQENITVYKNVAYGAKHRAQIRGYVIFEDETWGEAYNDKTSSHPNYPAMVPAETYEMEFEVADNSIVRVDKKGIIMPRGEGSTTVTVTIKGGHSFTVNVTVLADPPESADR